MTAVEHRRRPANVKPVLQIIAQYQAKTNKLLLIFNYIFVIF